MSWILLLISGTCVLVLSVTNFIISYPNTKMDKSMIIFFTSRIHIPHHLRNLQQCDHDVFIDFFKLFFDLRNPCEVELHGLWVLYLHILQLVPQCHIYFDILAFIYASHYTEHILGSLQGWYMWDPMEVEILILLYLTKSFFCFFFISLWIYSFFFDIFLQVMLLQVWEAFYTSIRGYWFLQASSQAWYCLSSW